MRRYLALLTLLSLFPLSVWAVHGDSQTELAGLKFHGSMKQIIGVFSTYGHPAVGDELNLDFGKLPTDKIGLSRPNFDPDRDVRPYIPFQKPFQVTFFERGKPEIGGSYFVLTSTDVNSKLVLQVWARELKPGTAAKIYFYEETFGRIGCMAEAEGVLK